MKRKILLAMSVLLLGFAVFCGVKFFLETYSPTNLKTEQFGPANLTVPDSMPTVTPAVDRPVTDNPGVQPSNQDENVITVDFASLQAINPDIYAWLYIPGTDISYPVVQHPTNDGYYLHINSDGEYSAGGAIFSEAPYNGKDFSDPVTVLYGHHMNAGNIMFGHLQDYFSDPDFLASDPHIYIYTPEGTFEYGVFAAVPFNKNHILFYNDFNNSEIYQGFFNSVLNIRELGVYTNEEYVPSASDNDRVLILSTCLMGNNTRRFLVMATLLSDQ